VSTRRRRWWQLNRCPHLHVRGVYGDEINDRDGRRRLCLDCGRALDGPLPGQELEDDPHQGLPTSSGSIWPGVVFGIVFVAGVIVALVFAFGGAR